VSLDLDELERARWYAADAEFIDRLFGESLLDPMVE
jgi:hypothetical protein